MTAGRKPKPTGLKVLEGNPGKQKLPQGEPKPGGEAECPAWLTRSAKAKWRRLAPELQRLGLLTSVDGDALAAYCESWAEYERAEKALQQLGTTYETSTGLIYPRPEVQMSHRARQQMHRFGAEFGLTPSSRARVGGPVRQRGGGDGDDLDDLLNRPARRAE